MTTLCEAALAVLATAGAAEKCRLTEGFAADWASGRIAMVGAARPPSRPARPLRPVLLPPREMPKRAYGGAGGRIALLHALAHIELNAIDLAWDILCRFPGEAMPREFYDDWVHVALDEARHFILLEDLLGGLGAAYGDLPAHDGLWQAAEKTAGDLMARLALVPMTLEARGCDTTPETIRRLERNGDRDTPPALDVIYRDEIGHVGAGVRWFAFLAERRGLDPARAYRDYLGRLFPGGLKPPFNHAARAEAGMPRAWYEPLARAAG
ncbi:MAG: ferritin-like domain-containing protein [Magnetospirillum sp.]|nr:ferritin-like domain-containing protein [Magnetospirillum sp.]